MLLIYNMADGGGQGQLSCSKTLLPAHLHPHQQGQLSVLAGRGAVLLVVGCSANSHTLLTSGPALHPPQALRAGEGGGYHPLTHFTIWQKTGGTRSPTHIHRAPLPVPLPAGSALLCCSGKVKGLLSQVLGGQGAEPALLGAEASKEQGLLSLVLKPARGRASSPKCFSGQGAEPALPDAEPCQGQGQNSVQSYPQCFQ